MRTNKFTIGRVSDTVRVYLRNVEYTISEQCVGLLQAFTLYLLVCLKIKLHQKCGSV